MTKVESLINNSVSWYKDSFWTQVIIKGVFIGILPTVFLLARFWTGLKNWLSADHKVMGWIAGLTIFFIFIDCFSTWWDAKHDTRNRAQTRLLNWFDGIVGKKLKRFAGALGDIRSLPKHKVNSGLIFEKITQPGDQIEGLMFRLYSHLVSLIEREGVEIKVVLAEIEDNVFKKFIHYYPELPGPRSDIEDLQNPSSGFSRAAVARQPIIIEDLKSEAHKPNEETLYLGTTDKHQEEEGSMILFPLNVQGIKEVPYVISVVVNKKSLFTKKNAKAYINVIERFSNRIMMEYCLLRLRREAGLS